MTIEKIDREKAQVHLDSHESAVVIVFSHHVYDVYFYGDTVPDVWDTMRLAYLADTPPQTAYQPDADGWVPWVGGECPVERGVLVDVFYADGSVNLGVSAALHPTNPEYVSGTSMNSAIDWRRNKIAADGDIIAYRLHKPEQTVQMAINGDKVHVTARMVIEPVE